MRWYPAEQGPPPAKPMDDQQGNVFDFDGTAPPRQRRRRPSRPRSEPDAAESRSEAPKSIASSIFVPGQRLDPTCKRAAETSNGASGEGPRRRNPFVTVAADSAVTPRDRRARARAITALIARPVHAFNPRPLAIRLQQRRFGSSHSRRLRVAESLGGLLLTAVAVVAVMALTSGAAGHRGSDRGAPASDSAAAWRVAVDRAALAAITIAPIIDRAAAAARTTASKHRRRHGGPRKRASRSERHAAAASRAAPPPVAPPTYTPQSTSDTGSSQSTASTGSSSGTATQPAAAPARQQAGPTGGGPLGGIGSCVSGCS
jgi:hypothetical protein